MRIPMVAGNWKMNKTVQEACALVNTLLPGMEAISGVERVLCPPATSLFAVSTMLTGSGIGLGAQNMHWEKSGAYTGELSPEMVRELCEYVIIGHSERRTLFGETDTGVNKKVHAALTTGIIPIVCVGETLEQYEAGKTAGVVVMQVREAMQGLTVEQANQVVVAYEPVWAIGTGRASSGADANVVVKDMIRPTISAMYGEQTAQSIRVLYGGSVKADNAAEFFQQSDIDGALVGGASLKVEEFIGIAKSAVK